LKISKDFDRTSADEDAGAVAVLERSVEVAGEGAITEAFADDVADAEANAGEAIKH